MRILGNRFRSDQMVIGAVAMPMILHFGNGICFFEQRIFHGGACILNRMCSVFLGMFFASSKRSSEERRTQKDDRRYDDEERLHSNTHLKTVTLYFLMLAMFTFLTGLFGRIGIMAYYFIYIMGDPLLIAGFVTAMSFGMLICKASTHRFF